MCRESRAPFLLVYTLKPTDSYRKLLKISNQQTKTGVNIYNNYICYINTNKISHKLSFENMISSQVKVTCFLNINHRFRKAPLS